jgi:hypothetical protein
VSVAGRRASAFAACALATACATAPSRPAPSAAAPPPPAPWVLASLASAGVSASFPAPPEEGSSTLSDYEIRQLSLTATDGTAMRFSLEIYRARLKGPNPDEADIARWLALGMKQVVHTERLTKVGFVGQALEGVAADGAVSTAVAYLAGRDLDVLRVVGPPATFDRVQQRRFFESVRIEPPLRIFPVVAGRFTVLVPTSARERVDDSGAADPATRVFTLGPPGRAPMVIVTALSLDGGLRSVPPESALRAIVGQLASGAGRSTFPELTPLTVHGAAGLEFTFTTTHDRAKAEPVVDWSRGRAFVVGDRIVSVRFVAATQEELSSALVADILGSLRWAPPS